VMRLRGSHAFKSASSTAEDQEGSAFSKKAGCTDRRTCRWVIPVLDSPRNGKSVRRGEEKASRQGKPTPGTPSKLEATRLAFLLLTVRVPRWEMSCPRGKSVICQQKGGSMRTIPREEHGVRLRQCSPLSERHPVLLSGGAIEDGRR